MTFSQESSKRRAEVDRVDRHRIAKAIVRLHIDMNSAAVQSQREINVAALTESASVMFAIEAMLAHPRGQLKMPRRAAYASPPFARFCLRSHSSVLRLHQERTRIAAARRFGRDPRSDPDGSRPGVLIRV